MPRHIPELFAILRDGIRSPCLQVLEAVPAYDTYGFQRQSLRGSYEIVNPRHVDEFQGRLIQTSYRETNNGSIYTLRYSQPDSDEPKEVYFWMTPYALETHGGQLIPLLEFQYRSWIPTGFYPIPVHTNLNELYAVLTRLQEQRLAEIRHREDDESMRHMRNREYPVFPDAFFGRQSMPISRPHTPPQTPPPRIVERIRVEERIVTQQKVLPLPKNVGDILIRDARAGKDTCPILQIPFTDCEKLAVSSCFHIFDAGSLRTWQQTHQTCPVCRCKIENVVSE